MLQLDIALPLIGLIVEVAGDLNEFYLYFHVHTSQTKYLSTLWYFLHFYVRES